MYMVQHVAGGVVALARAGHRPTGGVWAAIFGWVQLPAELAGDGEREVGLLLSWLPLQHTKHRDVITAQTGPQQSVAALAWNLRFLTNTQLFVVGDRCQEMFRVASEPCFTSLFMNELDNTSIFHPYLMQHRSMTIWSATHYAVNPLFGFTSEGSWFLVCAVVVVIAVNAISW